MTRTRHVVLALISGCVTINYLDRALLGISIPTIRQQFDLQPAMVGVVLSAFSWSYFLAQVPSGIMLDRIGTRPLYAGSLISWSLATMLHAVAGGLASLLSLRLLLGLAEAPCFPANSNVVAMWFPRSERARAIGIYTAALGILGGLFSASANLSGIVTPLVIGGIVQLTGSFMGALYFVGVVALIGACSWIFVIGDIRPLGLSFSAGRVV